MGGYLRSHPQPLAKEERVVSLPVHPSSPHIVLGCGQTLCPFGDLSIVAKAMCQVGLSKPQCLQPCFRALASPTFHQPSLLAE